MPRPAITFCLLLAGLPVTAPAHSQSKSPQPVLADGTWRVVEVGGKPAEHGETITIGNGRITARTACNTLSGPISRQGEHLRIGRLAVTLLPCNKDRRAAERRLFSALRAVTGHITVAGSSALTSEDRRVVMRLAR